MSQAFTSKAAVVRAMAPGSRWAVGHPICDDIRTRTGTIAHATSTSRWIVWDDAAPTERPQWIPVSDTRDWTVTTGGFVIDAGEEWAQEWSLLVAAPAGAADPKTWTRPAPAANRAPGRCVQCGATVAAGAGIVRKSIAGGFEVLHRPGACDVRSEAATVATAA